MNPHLNNIARYTGELDIHVRATERLEAQRIRAERLAIEAAEGRHTIEDIERKRRGVAER